MQHRISVGTLVLNENRLLLARHYSPGRYDFWAPPGGGVEGDEELQTAAERETFEETGICAQALRIAYIDELIDSDGRMVKFWFFSHYLSGEINVHSNPAAEERITEAGWFRQEELPAGHVFPAALRDDFWCHSFSGFPAPIKLPLLKSIF
ncbi:NUDIX domain-containing protein [uncultured Roseibium sp.]|uniref:NUDIX domain-containing protein n=1 Tax=uncultured Roseibium sp. TaxID=1936171 RepID=UPI0032168FF9